MQARMWHEGKTCSYFEKHATDVPRGFVERCDGQIRWVVFPPQQFQAINKRIGYNGPEFLVWKGRAPSVEAAKALVENLVGTIEGWL
jgi:hypothetical protein